MWKMTWSKRIIPWSPEGREKRKTRKKWEREVKRVQKQNLAPEDAVNRKL
jgi:hypothetical protein